MIDRNLAIAYEQLFMGNIPEIPIHFFMSREPGGSNERIALSVIRYAIENIMEWSVDTAIHKFDAYMVKALKLETLLPYIKYPTDFFEGDIDYVLSLLYPRHVNIDRVKKIENIFLTIAEEYQETGKAPQYPRDFFSGYEGFERYCICFSLILRKYKSFNSVAEIYDFFLSPKGSKLLESFRIMQVTYQQRINIIDVIYEVTKDNEDGELLYAVNLFNKKYNDK